VRALAIVQLIADVLTGVSGNVPWRIGYAMRWLVCARYVSSEIGIATIAAIEHTLIAFEVWLEVWHYAHVIS
jgi:hypothetical protein